MSNMEQQELFVVVVDDEFIENVEISRIENLDFEMKINTPIYFEII